MLRNYSGHIGTFVYDSDLWEFAVDDEGKDYLHWIGGAKECSLPKGCISCKRMFYKCSLAEGFKFNDFDTSQVIDMTEMFRDAKFYLDLYLGDEFDTSAVRDMTGMFYNTDMHGKFDFGDKFDTSKVMYMDTMFYGANISGEFNSGKLFKTTKAVTMNMMFEHCRIRHGVSFSEYFCLGDEHKDIFNDCVVCGDINLTKADPQSVIDDWTGKLAPKNPVGPAFERPTYDFTKIVDVPIATLRFCETKKEFDEVVERYCRC